MAELKLTDQADIDRFIYHVYHSALSVPPERFHNWALGELQQLVPFDGALWGSCSSPHSQFHTLAAVGMPEDFPLTLERTREINPIMSCVLANPGSPVDMRSVMPDSNFFHSEIYEQCYKPYNINRILSTAHFDQRSGLYFLLTLSRRDRRQIFSEQDHQNQQQATFHLFNAASHAFFLHLMHTSTDRPAESAVAAVDSTGIYGEAQPRFHEILEKYFPKHTPYTLPFPLPPKGMTTVVNGLCIRHQPLANLGCVSIWPERKLDRLTQREHEVVNAVVQGLSFKLTAQRMGISPSSVANHLYRSYEKLGVCNRSALAGLVYPTRCSLGEG